MRTPDAAVVIGLTLQPPPTVEAGELGLSADEAPAGSEIPVQVEDVPDRLLLLGQDVELGLERWVVRRDVRGLVRPVDGDRTRAVLTPLLPTPDHRWMLRA